MLVFLLLKNIRKKCHKVGFPRGSHIFPKNTIELSLKPRHSARTAIFGFLLEHLDFPAPKPL